KVALGVLIGVFTVLACTMGVHALMVNRQAGLLNIQAEQAEADNRFDDAANYYRLILAYAPETAEARTGWARVLERKQRRTFADQKKIFELHAATVKDQADNREARQKLIYAAM